MVKHLNQRTRRLFAALGMPVTAAFGYIIYSLATVTPENTAYLLQAIPLMLENAFAALTVLIGGGLIFDIAQKKDGIDT